jgi:hypothetical protein
MNEPKTVLRPGAAISLPSKKKDPVLLDNGNNILQWSGVNPSIIQALGMLEPDGCFMNDWVSRLGNRNTAYLLNPSS